MTEAVIFVAALTALAIAVVAALMASWGTRRCKSSRIPTVGTAVELQ